MRNRKVREKLSNYLFIFDEGYGTGYERYALNRFISQMVNKYGILKVLEMPANGVMGIRGINSLGFAELGCEVTVAHPSQEFLDTAGRIWKVFGLDANFVKSPYIDSVFADNTFDLVWNFCVYGHFKDPKRVIQEMVRVTGRYICIQFQNIVNPGFFIHRLQHGLQKEPWDHGDPCKMNISTVMNITSEVGGKIVEIGGIDMPPWPDIPVNLKEKIHRRGTDSGLSKEVDKECTNILRLFNIWYDFVEKKAPYWVKKAYAHHFSIIAEKIR